MKVYWIFSSFWLWLKTTLRMKVYWIFSFFWLWLKNNFKDESLLDIFPLLALVKKQL
jgi:hypothetical protein